MLVRSLFRFLEARGVDRYTLATWEAKFLSRHYQSVLEALVIFLAFLLVLLFAGVVQAGQA